MTANNVGDSRKAPAREPEKKKRPWPLKVIAWAIPIIGGTVLANYTVPAVHQAVAASVCVFKYATAPQVTKPPPTAWTAFGSSQLTGTASAIGVRPSPAMGAADEWFGASLPFAASCDYKVEFQATLTGPLYNVPGAGFGYGIGARGDVDNGVPAATTIQYDPPFGGLRTVDVPNEANTNGYPPTPFPGITAGRSHHWIVVVKGDTMLASLDGRAYVPVRLDAGDGNQLIVRVWNAMVTISDVTITRLWPKFHG